MNISTITKIGTTAMLVIFAGLLFSTSIVRAQSCEIPASCSPGESVSEDCQPVTAPIPCFTGNEPIHIEPGRAGDILHNDITEDDNGLLGTKRYDNENNSWSAACGASGDNLQDIIGPLCKDEIIIESPDSSLPVKGFWWRMHDHEDDLDYEMYVCRQGLVNGDCTNWGTPVQSAEVHTSSQDCGYICSGNQDVHAPYGNGDQGCGGPIPDLKDCHVRDERVSWPCAVSYDEHVWNTNNCTPQAITAIKLKFTGENGHVHIADTLWIFDAPSCTIQGNKRPDTNPYRGREVTLRDGDGNILETSNEQPYFFRNLPAGRTYRVGVQNNTLLGSTMCRNATGCHDAGPVSTNPAFSTGATRTINNCPGGDYPNSGFMDLWWWYGNPPTPTNTPRPTNTPTPTTTPEPTDTPTPTPTPVPEPCTQDKVITLPEAPPNAAGKINMSIMFQGVDWDNIVSEEVKDQLVDVTVSRQTADNSNRTGIRTLISRTYENVLFHAEEHEDGGPIAMWKGSFEPTGMGPADDYSILIKGPMHVRRKICEDNPADEAESGLPYNCNSVGSISLTEEENSLNFSKVLLNAGDLPVSGSQDGVVNAHDISAIINMLKNGKSSDQSDLKISDMDLNGVVNAKDRSYLIETLEEKYGDEE